MRIIFYKIGIIILGAILGFVPALVTIYLIGLLTGPIPSKGMYFFAGVFAVIGMYQGYRSSKQI